MQKFITTVAIALLLFAGRTAWRMVADEPVEEYDAAAEAAAWDEEIEASFRDGTSAPARGWLAQRGNGLFEGDAGEVNALIDSLYAAGAQDVRFVHIEKLAGVNIAASIAARMPADPAARARILRAEADFWQETEPADDEGQRFVEFSFD